MSDKAAQFVEAVKHRASIGLFALAAGAVGGDFTDVIERDHVSDHDHPEIVQLAGDVDQLASALEDLQTAVTAMDKRLERLDTREQGFEERVLELLEILRESG